MLDSLGGKQPQSSPWFDSLSSTVNSNSSISSSSGSPPSLSHFGSAELSRPSWLFNSQCGRRGWLHAARIMNVSLFPAPIVDF
ncbi:unnamed protein product [Heligmosomoides polygyrus]|uniref:Uncharacterized protein n=1 Tax=Heligmosomoides polygyrus TaxID=6339 RepID=A0A183GLA3_HELPZ|nr:unnamed protein product [Heligmosomoides polygyrus]